MASCASRCATSQYCDGSGRRVQLTLPTTVAYTSSYDITVKTQPAGLACNVTNGSGTMPADAVNNVVVSCTDQPFTLGGTISGLGANAGLVLANGSSTLTVPAGATSFTLPAPVAYASTYAVTMQSNPSGLMCSVTNGSGTMGAQNITNVSVTCSDQSYALSGTISGLTAQGLVLAARVAAEAVVRVASRVDQTLPVDRAVVRVPEA